MGKGLKLYNCLAPAATLWCVQLHAEIDGEAIA
jgi:hypothetical protein